MSTAAALGLHLIDPSRLVYVRDDGDPRLLDGWTVGESLTHRLRRASELVLLDPISFPYEQLHDADRAVPVTAVLPPALSAGEVEDLLGRPLLEHLTPYDRLLASGEVLDELRAMSVLPPVEEIRLAPGEDALERLHGLWRAERLETVDACFGRFTGYRDDLITRHVRQYGAHQRSDLAMLRSVVRPGDTVLDIGAHVGSFAVPLALACGETGHVFAFEAAASSAELLAENLEQNDIGWATVVHTAISDRSGAGVRSVPVDTSNTGAAVADRTWTGGGQLRTTAVDDWWRAAGRPGVDVMKIDVEGLELHALRGASDLIEEHHPVVFVEVSEQQLASAGVAVRDVVNFLAARGYEFHVNQLERNRPDDEFSLRRIEPGDPMSRPVEDVLCTVGTDRIARGR